MGLLVAMPAILQAEIQGEKESGAGWKTGGGIGQTPFPSRFKIQASLEYV